MPKVELLFNPATLADSLDRKTDQDARVDDSELPKFVEELEERTAL